MAMFCLDLYLTPLLHPSDLPLLPLVFILMSVLCIVLFARRDKVLSRSWLGFGAVVTVLLAIIASFGLLFVIGVPFTSLTPLLPFSKCDPTNSQ